MNRDQRRHPERTEQTDHETPSSRPDEEQLKPGRQQDDFSVRAKNSGHGKKTADKWNQ